MTAQVFYSRQDDVYLTSQLFRIFLDRRTLKKIRGNAEQFGNAERQRKIRIIDCERKTVFDEINDTRTAHSHLFSPQENIPHHTENDVIRCHFALRACRSLIQVPPVFTHRPHTRTLDDSSSCRNKVHQRYHRRPRQQRSVAEPECCVADSDKWHSLTHMVCVMLMSCCP
jgi:hypothetical protein